MVTDEKVVLRVPVGHFTLEARCNRGKDSITNVAIALGSNQIQSPALYHIAIKAGLYHKTVQVYYIARVRN